MFPLFAAACGNIRVPPSEPKVISSRHIFCDISVQTENTEIKIDCQSLFLAGLNTRAGFSAHYDIFFSIGADRGYTKIDSSGLYCQNPLRRTPAPCRAS
jgi:hypothetical protein